MLRTPAFAASARRDLELRGAAVHADHQPPWPHLARHGLGHGADSAGHVHHAHPLAQPGTLEQGLCRGAEDALQQAQPGSARFARCKDVSLWNRQISHVLLPTWSVTRPI
jgi:hypothetical protein